MRIRALHGLALAAALVLGAPVAAQPQTLADIKAELTVLNGQIEQLRNELVRSGSSGGLPVDPASALTRLDQLEAELRRLTDRVEIATAWGGIMARTKSAGRLRPSRIASGYAARVTRTPTIEIRTM